MRHRTSYLDSRILLVLAQAHIGASYTSAMLAPEYSIAQKEATIMLTIPLSLYCSLLSLLIALTLYIFTSVSLDGVLADIEQSLIDYHLSVKCNDLRWFARKYGIVGLWKIKGIHQRYRVGYVRTAF